jgi:hypothetical protein
MTDRLVRPSYMLTKKIVGSFLGRAGHRPRDATRDRSTKADISSPRKTLRRVLYRRDYLRLLPPVGFRKLIENSERLWGKLNLPNH